jgi:hypothetical protein
MQPYWITCDLADPRRCWATPLCPEGGQEQGVVSKVSY